MCHQGSVLLESCPHTGKGLFHFLQPFSCPQAPLLRTPRPTSISSPPNNPFSAARSRSERGSLLTCSLPELGPARTSLTLTASVQSRRSRGDGACRALEEQAGALWRNALPCSPLAALGTDAKPSATVWSQQSRQALGSLARAVETPLRSSCWGWGGRPAASLSLGEAERKIRAAHPAREGRAVWAVGSRYRSPTKAGAPRARKSSEDVARETRTGQTSSAQSGRGVPSPRKAGLLLCDLQAVR